MPIFLGDTEITGIRLGNQVIGDVKLGEQDAFGDGALFFQGQELPPLGRVTIDGMVGRRFYIGDEEVTSLLELYSSEPRLIP